MGNWSYGSNILDLGNRWRWFIGLTPRPLCLGTHLVSYCVCPRVDVNDVEPRKSLTCTAIEPRSSGYTFGIPSEKSRFRNIFRNHIISDSSNNDNNIIIVMKVVSELFIRISYSVISFIVSEINQ